MREVVVRSVTSADVGAIAAILREVGWFAHISGESSANSVLPLTS